MSGDDLRHAGAGETGTAPDERLTPLVGGRTPDDSTFRDDDDAVPKTASPLDEALADDVTVDGGLVTESLDEILLAMIASSSGDTHGTGLMDGLERRFDAQLSPGTVYPRLHELEEDDVLDVHELVQTKQYSISERADAEAMIERAMRQHLAMGAFLRASLESM